MTDEEISLLAHKLVRRLKEYFIVGDMSESSAYQLIVEVLREERLKELRKAAKKL